MSEPRISYNSGGLNFFGALGIAFIVLKLCGVINWPWLWVLWPIWLPLTLMLLISIAVFVIGLIAIAYINIIDKINEFLN